MDEIKPKKRANLPLIIGFIDVTLIVLSWLFFKDGTSMADFASLLGIVGVTLLLSFRLTKSSGAGIGMILWGCFRWLAIYAVQYFFPETDIFFDKNSLCAWLPIIAGVLGLLSIHWRKKAESELEDCDVDALIMKKSVFAVITTFYLLLFSVFVLTISNRLYYRELFYVISQTVGDGIYCFSLFFRLLGETWNIEILEEVFHAGQLYLWCFALLPTYFVYLGMNNPFSKKNSMSLSVMGVALTFATSIGAVRQFLDEENGIMHALLVGISVVCILAGYFYFCKKLPVWSYIPVGCGFLIYAPLILLVVVLAIGFAILKALGKIGEGSSSGKQWVVVENGVKYTIQEMSDGTYFDDQNCEWKTDDGGLTFYRKN